MCVWVGGWVCVWVGGCVGACMCVCVLYVQCHKTTLGSRYTGVDTGRIEGLSPGGLDVNLSLPYIFQVANIGAPHSHVRRCHNTVGDTPQLRQTLGTTVEATG